MTTLVAGVDSSTQSVKVVIRDTDTGALVRQGRASHPDGSEVDPRFWEQALDEALTSAGGLGDVAALAIGGQQHGMVCLDQSGEVVPRTWRLSERCDQARASSRSRRRSPWCQSWPPWLPST